MYFTHRGAKVEVEREGLWRETGPVGCMNGGKL